MGMAMPPLSSMSRESTTSERAMQIHLATPGGEKQGPYTLEQINRDLAAKKYRDTDYWAWYDGAEAWVPLYAVPGISPASDAEASPAAVASELARHRRRRSPEPPHNHDRRLATPDRQRDLLSFGER